MSALVHSERWRARFAVCLAVFALGLLAVGAKGVNTELRHRRGSTPMGTAARMWSDTLLLEQPVEDRQAWQAVLAERPDLLLQACAMARPVQVASGARGDAK